MKRADVSKLFQGEHPSRWSFWDDGVSSSLLAKWLTCREQFRLEFVEGYRQMKDPIYISFGTLGHWILERAYSKPKPPSGKWVSKMVGEYAKQWKKENKKPTQTQLENQTLARGLIKQILPIYFKRWAGDWPGKTYPKNPTGFKRPKKWLDVEVRFSIPFTFADGKTLPIRGTRDGVYEDSKGKLWVMDHKFLSVVLEGDIVETFPYNFQQMLYLWAFYREFEKMPRGSVLNVVRRPGHRQKKDESVADFCNRVGEDVANPSKYDHNFIRFSMEIFKKELIAWEVDQLTPILHDMRDWWEGKSQHYLNPLALNR